MPSENIPQKLEADEIHLWLCEAEKISEPLVIRRYLELLTPEEDEKRLRFRFEKHQHQFLITRALIRTLLSHYLPGHRAEDWRFDKNQWGKPELLESMNPSNLRFNLSHTDGLICCALTLSNDLGVDVENVSREGETVKIADRYFSSQEHASLIKLPEQEQDARFFDLWTLKESYIKACGKGLAISLSDFSFSFGLDKNIGIDFVESRNDDPSSWEFHSYLWGEYHKIALGLRNLTNDTGAFPKIRQFKTVPLLSQTEIFLEEQFF